MVRHEKFDAVVPLRLLPAEGEPPGKARVGRLSALKAFVRRWAWFTLVVLIPTASGIAYFGWLASDIYVAEAQFIVRSADKPQANPLGMVLQDIGLKRSHEDTLTIHAFMTSRDAVRIVDERASLTEVLGRPEADVLMRHPRPWGGQTEEELYSSYLRFVGVGLDADTGISVLSVRAFRPEDAQSLATILMEESEALVNRLNNRAREDALSTARRDVAEAEQRVADVQVRMADFRIREDMLDPTTASAASLELIGALTAELAAARTQVSQISERSPNSPQLRTLRSHITALEQEIAAERAKLVSTDDQAIVGKIAEYERLKLEQELALKALASASSSLETARSDAQRQQLYLERIVEPNRPDYPLYPRRIPNILTIFFASLLVYGIGWLLAASFREHASR